MPGQRAHLALPRKGLFLCPETQRPPGGGGGSQAGAYGPGQRPPASQRAMRARRPRGDAGFIQGGWKP